MRAIIITNMLLTALMAGSMTAVLLRGVDGICVTPYPLTQDPASIWQPTGRIGVPTQADLGQE